MQSYPVPPSDPESEGMPGTADDDSTADPGPDDLRDGPDPVALPVDRTSFPGSLEATGEDDRRGRSLGPPASNRSRRPRRSRVR